MEIKIENKETRGSTNFSCNKDELAYAVLSFYATPILNGDKRPKESAVVVF